MPAAASAGNRPWSVRLNTSLSPHLVAVRRRLQTHRFFRELWRALRGVGWGTVVAGLVGRLLGWPILVLVPCLVVATALATIRIWRAGRWRVPDWQIAAWLDRASGARGAVMRLVETGHGEADVPASANDLQPELPRDPRPAAELLVMALTAVAALLVAPPAPRTAPSIAVEQVAALVEAADLDPALAEQARRELEALRHRADGLRPQDFAVLERLAQAARQERQESAPSSGALSRWSTDVQRWSDSEPALDQAATAEAERLLAAAEGLPGAQPVREALQRLHERRQEQARTPGPQQRQAVEQARRALQEQLSRLQIGAEAVAEAIPGDARGTGPAAPGEGAPEGGEGSPDAEGEGDQPGDGQPGRGGGPSPLVLGDPTAPRAETGPATWLGTPGAAPSVVLGRSLTRRGEDSAAPAAGPDVGFAPGTTTPYWQKRSLPRHEAALRAYFSESP
jgi:hypothetical protein